MRYELEQLFFAISAGFKLSVRSVTCMMHGPWEYGDRAVPCMVGDSVCLVESEVERRELDTV